MPREYEDSDLESVSTASCSDDDEIDAKAIRTMSCNFLEKKKSGKFDDIIAQKKASVVLMKQLSSALMTTSAPQSANSNVSTVSPRSGISFRKLSGPVSAEDGSSHPRIPAPPKSAQDHQSSSACTTPDSAKAETVKSAAESLLNDTTSSSASRRSSDSKSSSNRRRVRTVGFGDSEQQQPATERSSSTTPVVEPQTQHVVASGPQSSNTLLLPASLEPDNSANQQLNDNEHCDSQHAACSSHDSTAPDAAASTDSSAHKDSESAAPNNDTNVSVSVDATSEATDDGTRDGESAKKSPPIDDASTDQVTVGIEGYHEAVRTPTPPPPKPKATLRSTAMAMSTIPKLLSLASLAPKAAVDDTQLAADVPQQTSTISPPLAVKRLSTSSASPTTPQRQDHSYVSHDEPASEVRALSLPKAVASVVTANKALAAFGAGGVLSFGKKASSVTPTPPSQQGDHEAFSRRADDEHDSLPAMKQRHDIHAPNTSVPTTPNTSQTPRGASQTKSVSDPAWTKSAFLVANQRSAAPDTAGLFGDDSISGGEDAEQTREAIIRKEKALQEKMKTLKNLVGASNIMLGGGHKAAALSKSPRGLVPLGGKKH